MARALARALPHAGARPDVETCEQMYAPLWKTFLVDKGVDWDETRAANDTSHFLGQQGASDGLVRWEKEGTSASTSRTETFAGLLEGGSLWSNWSSFTEGMALLQRLTREGRAPEELQAVFSGLRGVWSQSFRVVAFGALMVDLCHRLGIDADLAKSLTITYADKSKPTRIIGTPRPGTKARAALLAAR
ncbi:MAG: hypothetical protein IT372_08640 [Polyangiaceae bacterium]|nr:hypothetical protein [Polyangiaceae bacterium]